VLVAGGRCQDMMEQLLIFSRAQQKLLDCAAQDPAMLARVAVLQLRSENPELVAEINIEPLCVVIADRTLLSLVLRHLLDNAIRFARPGVPAVIQVSTHLTPTMWVLSIADNGMGVAPEYRETVFRMFRRLNAEDAYPGPGVGLPLCRRIARRHGGDVRFVDCPTGARVTLTLPRALNRTDEAANSPAP
jgi:signal transduction histidine kinase